MNTKTILSLVATVSLSLFAGVVGDFHQYDASAFTVGSRAEQPWLGASWLSLNVTAGTSVWLTDYVRSWYEPVPDLGQEMYNMTQFGYVFRDDIQNTYENPSEYMDKIIWSNGQTTDITYAYDGNSSITQTTKGYYLDTFDKDSEIFFVMKTLNADGGEVVDSYQYVQDATHSTSLVSRVAGTYDLAGNVRINFGINEGSNGREFVAVFNEPEFGGVTGQPLPGVLVSSIIGGGVVMACRRLRRKKETGN